MDAKNNLFGVIVQSISECIFFGKFLLQRNFFSCPVLKQFEIFNIFFRRFQSMIKKLVHNPVLQFTLFTLFLIVFVAVVSA